jgi:phage-related minor tail protein
VLDALENYYQSNPDSLADIGGSLSKLGYDLNDETVEALEKNSD